MVAKAPFSTSPWLVSHVQQFLAGHARCPALNCSRSLTSRQRLTLSWTRHAQPGPASVREMPVQLASAEPRTFPPDCDACIELGLLCEPDKSAPRAFSCLRCRLDRKKCEQTRKAKGKGKGKDSSSSSSREIKSATKVASLVASPAVLSRRPRVSNRSGSPEEVSVAVSSSRKQSNNTQSVPKVTSADPARALTPAPTPAPATNPAVTPTPAVRHFSSGCNLGSGCIHANGDHTAIRRPSSTS